MQRPSLAHATPEIRFVHRQGLHVDEPLSPRRNLLLASLPQNDYEAVLADIEPVPLVRGQTIYGCHDEQSHLYFIAAGIVVSVYETELGSSSGFAITGNEGVFGIASFLGGKSMLTHTLVIEAGLAYRMKTEAVRRTIASGGWLLNGLLCHIQAEITQLTLDVGCTRHHAIEQQLCRWLLECLDRSSKNEFTMTQELMSQVLGVRREGVTVAAGNLRSAGLIEYSRGRLTIRNRAALEARACECYAVSRCECNRLLPGSTTKGRNPRGRVA